MTVLMDCASEPTRRYLGMLNGLEAAENDSTIDSNDVRTATICYQVFRSNFVAMIFGF